MKKISIYLMIFTILSQFFGFLKEITLSYFYGASYVTDAYLIAITIPSTLFVLIGTAIISAYIPTYNKILTEENNEKAVKFTSNLLNIILIICIFIVIIIFIFTRFFVQLFASGFEGEVLSLTIKFTRISIFGIFITSLVYVFKGYLQIKNSYFVAGLISIPFNIISIIAIVLSASTSRDVLIYGYIIALISQIMIFLPFLIKKGYKHKLKLDLKDPNIKFFC